MIRVTRQMMSEPDSANAEELPLGKQLQRQGKLSEREIKAILVAQHERGQLFGETAVSLGLLTSADIQRALATQFSYPYVLAEGSGLADTLVTAHQPFSAAAEAIRGLRSQLRLTWLDDKRCVIVVTAPRAKQGASTMAANLAIVFAQSGERTLLIDANMRAPSQRSLFGLNSSPGLAGLLSGRVSPKEATLGVAPIPTLAVLCAGMTPPNPQELLDGLRFSYLVETAPSSFDIVIIDTPPLLECADALLVASRVGGCLLVTPRHRTKLQDANQAKMNISQAGVRLIGAVITE